MLYYRSVSSQLQYLEHLQNQVNEALPSKPEGHLIIHSSHNHPQFYFKRHSSDTYEQFIRKENHILVVELAQKEYEKRLLKVLCQQRQILLRLQENKQQRSASFMYHALADVYDHLPAARKALIQPYVLPDALFIQQWLSRPYKPQPFSDHLSSYYTRKGVRVRSKSEKIIFDLVDNLQIPNLYEYPVDIGMQDLYHPDGTLLDIREREEVIYEHFGKMHEHGYCMNALSKIDQFERAGYPMGDRFLCSFEGGRIALNIASIESTLRQRFIGE